jgi:hypothetical protein
MYERDMLLLPSIHKILLKISIYAVVSKTFFSETLK